MDNITPGTKVRFDYCGTSIEGLVIITETDSTNDQYVVIVDPSYNIGEPLARHVTKGQFDHDQYRCVDNITDYHGKHHVWVYNNYVTAIIEGTSAVKTIDNSGCSCFVCGQFNPMSEPNQPDNTFKCYSCRVQPLRAYY